MAKLPGAIAGARIVGERFVQSQRRHNPDGRMPLMDHIRELRNRVLKMALGLIAGMILGFVFFHWAFHLIEHPLCAAVVDGHTGCNTLGANKLVLDGPLDTFYMRVKIAFLVGLVVSCPIWLYQLWAFVAPGLYAREKRWSYIFLGSAVPLFLIGITLAYWSLTRTMDYLLHLTPQGVSNLIDFDQYLSLVMTMMLTFGGACVALVEVAEFIVWNHDRRRARLHPDPYAGLADDELSPIDLGDTDPDPDRRSRFN